VKRKSGKAHAKLPASEEWLRQLAAEGQVRLATRPFRKRKLSLNRGKSLSRILLDDRGR